MNHLKHLPAFVQAAERGSFAAAGEALALTGSAVSKAVALLEAELGVPLFVRSTRGIALTGDGREFLSRCKAALSALDHARDSVSASNRRVRGRLRVLMHPMPGRGRVAAALPELLAQHPELDVQLVFYEGYPGLEAAGADLALVVGDPELGDTLAGPAANLVVLPLANSPQWICASPGYVERRGSPQRPEDLLEHPCIAIVAPNGQPVTRWRLSGPDRRCVIDIRPLVTYNDGPACRAAAMAGHGIVRLPKIALDHEVSSRQLVRLLPDWYSATAGLNLVFPGSARRVPRVRAFIGFLQRLFADLAPVAAPHPAGYDEPDAPLHRWRARDPMGHTVVPVPR
jgi:DNA-binding transcriptional LysR family regulator